VTQFLQVVPHRLSAGETTALDPAPRIIYSIDDNAARFDDQAVALDSSAEVLSFELVATPAPHALLSAPLEIEDDDERNEARLMRLDRVDFPPGGVAYLHTHQGPGIRVLLHGEIRIDTGGASHKYGPLEAWFETGPDPVFAAASETDSTAFVRCMILPRRLLGQSSIRYVREEDAAKPKPQRYTVFVDEPLSDTARAS
jgi:quercetin dioxygenase-like cupin family protein